ncbi:excisionase family DNA-binding protein [Sediminibacterium soli]|uniref:excisionase family DNA-binding protein n=1 Tax=Sediminibacterium soli TaxID=2698829 RepID=UPI00137AB8CE|nr:excisionase family DNA-binding protein [Sediminibacterium soli]NCI45042.1 excisionase family DNA-binding protein [Sediminibacterium soli]
MKGILLQQTDMQELETLIRGIIREEFSALTKTSDNSEANSQVEEPFLNKMEASQLLGVSLPTFSKLLHDGCVKSYQIGRRRKFKRSELLASIRSKNRQVNM